MKTSCPQKANFTFIISAAMMLMIGVISSDIYLPAMPSMQTYFHAPYAAIQHTIYYYMLALAFFQLLAGTLSDSLGQYRCYQLGIGLYLIASIGCMLAFNLPMLFAFRMLQGIGACFVLVFGRRIIPACFSATESTRLFSIVLPMVACSVGIAPAIGGFLVTHLDWRATFGFLILFATILVFLNNKNYQQYNFSNQRQQIALYKILINYSVLLKDWGFIKYTLIIFISYFLWFSYLSDSAHIFHEFGLSAQQIGFCYITQSAASVLASRTGIRILKRYSLKNLLLFAQLITLVGFAILLLVGVHSFWLFLMAVTIMAYLCGNCVTFGISTSMHHATENHPTLSGTASGLVGFFQLLGGAIGTLFVSFFYANVVNLIVIISCAIIISIIINLSNHSAGKTI